jgi:hypothetical protein
VEIRVNSETPTADSMAGFGPVVERTINDINEKLGKECLSLESGEIIDFNEQAIKALPKAEQLKWFDDRSVNLLTDSVEGQRGSASSRFHRPPKGLGLSEMAQRHIRSMRMFSDAMNVFSCAPHNDLLSDRAANEAYCLAEVGEQYAVYFPNGGAVKLDLSALPGPRQVRWLDIARSAWQEPQTVTDGKTLELKAPGQGHWAVLILTES